MSYDVPGSHRSRLWELIAKKKTKDGYTEISAIVTEIHKLIQDAYEAGLSDAIEELQAADEYSLALDALCRRFRPDWLTEEDGAA